MTRNLILLILTLFAFQGLKAQCVSRCAASPDPVVIRQPDGSLITLVGKGDILVNYAETTDGYTVVKNDKGLYEYAIRDAKSGGLIPSGIKAHDPEARARQENAFLVLQPAQLRYSPEKIDEIISSSLPQKQFKQALPDQQTGSNDEKPVNQSFPPTGKRNVLVLLIQYPDMKAKYTAQNFQDMMTKANYNGTGSFKDFYLQNSFGKLEVNVDVYGWYTAVNNYSHYGNSNGFGVAQELVAEAIDSAHAAGVDFSKYDNDKDGDVDGILIVHAGPGAEEGSQTQYIWSHRSVLGGYSRTYNGVKINNYVINPETRGGVNGRMVGIGVYCHEFGHLFGLPDLYDIFYRSAGVGIWSLMGGGSWLNNEYTPACFDAWSKIFLKWITPKTISADGIYNLKASAEDTMVYKVTTPVKHEYFLLENRQFTGFDSKLYGRGLAIWHIDDSVINATLGSNTTNADASKKGIDLLEADGRDDLDKNTNRGDAGDLYPGTSLKTSVDDATYPNAKTYNSKISGVRIFNIKQLSDSSIQFGFGALPQASMSIPAVVCANTQIAMKNYSQFAESYLWDFGDGNTDTTYSPVYVFTKPGSYYVKLTVKSTKGELSSDSVKITVNPNANADFYVDVAGRDVTIHNKTIDAKGMTWYWGDNKIGYTTDTLIKRIYKSIGTYNIKLVAYGASGCNDTLQKTINITEDYSGIEEASAPMFKMSAYPNPVSQDLNIRIDMKQNAMVELNLFNYLGEKLAVLTNSNLSQGTHVIQAEMPANLPAGMYLVQAIVDQQVYSISLIKR